MFIGKIMNIMNLKGIFSKLALMLLALGLSSCGKNADNKMPVVPPAQSGQSELKMDALLTEQGCLSAEKLGREFGALDRTLSVNIVPTKLAFDSKKSIRPNFEKLIALNQLVIEQKPISEIFDLEPATQADCESVTLNRASGPKAFEIKDSSQKMIRFRSEDGEEIEYQLIASRTLHIKRKYIAYDVPCQSEKTPIFVGVEKLFDWSGAPVPDAVDSSNSQYSIDKPFLVLASQAVGRDTTELYIQEETQEMLSLLKVRELAQLSPLPEIVSCTGAVEEPEEPTEPAEPTEPNPTSEEDEGNRAGG